jgi:hypothetical protein
VHTLGVVGLFVVAASLASPAHASLIPGNPKKPDRDCYALFQVGAGTTLATSNTVQCTDGDASCDSDSIANQCTFSAAMCLNQASTTAGCTPPGPGAALTSVKTKKAAKPIVPPTDLSSSTCSAPADIVVRVKARGRNPKPGKAKLKATTKSPVAPKKDNDTVTLICNPAGTGPGEAVCPQNPQGGPDQLNLVVADTGTDLDNGWTGVSHNFPVDPRAELKVCLSGCDASTNPVCDINGPTGANSLNGETFGPPLPLITQSVPVCVINRYQPGPVTGKLNLQTGVVAPETPLQVNLFSEVHFTFTDAVCPRCVGPNATDYGGTGTCSGGDRNGAPCTVESILTVALADGDKVYRLSKSCPPSASQNVGTLDIRLPLTTGTATKTGSRPCRAMPGDPSQGVNVQDDACGGSGCSAGNCTGPACLSRNAQNECIDSKGGISQHCCTGNTTTPCFPTANNGTIERTGAPGIPRDGNGLAWPEGTYPKTSTEGKLAAIFCEAATTASVVNSATGLPGPGALLLPGSLTLLEIQ